MIPTPARAHRNIALFGLGASGVATARALADAEACVFAWDDDTESRARAGEAGVTLADPEALDWSRLDALVLSPGVPLTHPAPHPVAAAAAAAGCAVIGDIELLVEACPEATFIGITGTNGKSTTTALIAHVLDQAGRAVQVGGNLGPPALSLEPLDRDGVYVLELSSYQLDLVREARFGIAVLLNISPDHLDRHGDMAGYAAAKRRLFRDRAGGGQTAIVGVDDDHGRALADDIAARPGWHLVRISSGRRLVAGVYATDGLLFDAIDGPADAPVGDLRRADTLPGAHNWQNAAAAYAAARVLGVAPAVIARHLTTYPGLAHRQEIVAVIDGVRYVNDSKATNPDAAACALASYEAIYWIAGGRAKDGGLDAAHPFLDHVRRAFLIGEAAVRFAAELDGRVDVERCGDLATALSAAHALARRERIEGAVVLLSPACASFDQWPNFMARGDAFRDRVRGLAREVAP